MDGKLLLDGTVYNAMNSNRYQLDAFSDLDPRLEILPNTTEEIRFFVSATYNY